MFSSRAAPAPSALGASARPARASSSADAAAAAFAPQPNRKRVAEPRSGHLLALPSREVAPGRDAQFPKPGGARCKAAQLQPVLSQRFKDTDKQAIRHPYHHHPLTQFVIKDEWTCTCDLCGLACSATAEPDETILRTINLTHADEKDTFLQTVWICTEESCGISSNANNGSVRYVMCSRCMWNDPGGLAFKNHVDGDHLCYRSTFSTDAELHNKGVKCSGCGTAPVPSDVGDNCLKLSQFWRCFQKRSHSCLDWAICVSCLEKCDRGLRERSYEDGGIAPPQLERMPPLSAAAAAAAAALQKDPQVVAILASLQAAIDVVDWDDTDVDEADNETRRAVKAKNIAKRHKHGATAFSAEAATAAASNSAPSEFLPLETEPPDSLISGLTKHHAAALTGHWDLRQWPAAQLLTDGQRRLELGASMLEWASFHGYVTMELDVVSVLLDDAHDFRLDPVVLNGSQEEDYNPATKTYGRGALSYCTWDVLDFKENRPREQWLQLLAWRALDIGNNDEAFGRICAQREFVRERIVNHLRYVRPTVILMRHLQEGDNWKKLPEHAIEHLDAGRGSYTHKDWDKLWEGYNKPVDAPFLTRIPWGCLSQFQLAPNVQSLESLNARASAGGSGAPTAAAPSAGGAAGAAPITASATIRAGRAADAVVFSKSPAVAPSSRAAQFAAIPASSTRVSASAQPPAAAASATSASPSSSDNSTCATSQQGLQQRRSRRPRAPWTSATRDVLWQIQTELHLAVSSTTADMQRVIDHPNFPFKDHYRDIASHRSLQNVCRDQCRAHIPKAKKTFEAARRAHAAARKKK